LLPIFFAGGFVLGASALLDVRERRNARAQMLAVLGSCSGNPQQVEGTASFILELDPSFARARAVRAVALAKLGRLDEAQQDLDVAEEGDEAQRTRAWIAFREARIDEAKRLLEGVHGGMGPRR